jgi:alanine racemase
MKLFRFLRAVKKSLSHYSPLIEVLISKNNLLHNLNEYKQQYPKLSPAPVLKSNAYGHGLIQVAQILDKEGIAFFVVDSLYEAMVLQNEGIKSQILVMGYISPGNINISKLSRVAFTITSLEHLQEIARIITTTKKFHLKIDTGMHRQGILLNQINEAIKIIKAHKFIFLEGICSHFADADNTDGAFTKFQIDQWQKITQVFRRNFRSVVFFHIAASAGTYYSEQIDSNAVRLGRGLYGINPSPLAKLSLKPVLQMQSVISSIKTVPAGEYVGYNITYKTEKNTKIALVPVGYFEGVDRRLSNCGVFKIRNHYCPIIGRVSMNITSIDVTSAPKVGLGDTVIIISNNREDMNSIENIAKIARTIPHEILVHIPQHLRRKIIET